MNFNRAYLEEIHQRHWQVRANKTMTLVEAAAAAAATDIGVSKSATGLTEGGAADVTTTVCGATLPFGATADSCTGTTSANTASVPTAA